MSNDGAHLGISAERALGTILGGEPSPSEDERMTDEQFEAWVRSCPEIIGPSLEDGSAYGDIARLAAKWCLIFLEANPEHLSTPIETEGAWCDAAGIPLTTEQLRERLPEGAEYRPVRDGLYDVMKRAGIDMGSLDLTGFMWGWAFNAAHKILGRPPQPNPAIVEIEV